MLLSILCLLYIWVCDYICCRYGFLTAYRCVLMYVYGVYIDQKKTWRKTIERMLSDRRLTWTRTEKGRMAGICEEPLWKPQFLEHLKVLRRRDAVQMGIIPAYWMFTVHMFCVDCM